MKNQRTLWSHWCYPGFSTTDSTLVVYDPSHRNGSGLYAVFFSGVVATVWIAGHMTQWCPERPLAIYCVHHKNSSENLAVKTMKIEMRFVFVELNQIQFFSLQGLIVLMETLEAPVPTVLNTVLHSNELVETELSELGRRMLVVKRDSSCGHAMADWGLLLPCQSVIKNIPPFSVWMLVYLCLSEQMCLCAVGFSSPVGQVKGQYWVELYMYFQCTICIMFASYYNVTVFIQNPGTRFCFFCVLRLRHCQIDLRPSKGPWPPTLSSPHHAAIKPHSSQTVLLLSTPFIWCKHLPHLCLLEPLRAWMSHMPW